MGLYLGGPSVLSFLSPQYRITAIVLTEEGQAIHKTINLDSTEGEAKIGETSYKITKAGLYEKNKFFMTRPIFKALRIRFYWILFNEGQPDHIKPRDPLIGPRDLYIMANSRILKRALSELLSSRGISSRLLLVGLFLAIIVIYYLLTGGNFNL